LYYNIIIIILYYNPIATIKIPETKTKFVIRPISIYKK